MRVLILILLGVQCFNHASVSAADGETWRLFACNQPGKFPDPLDCQMYHICSQYGSPPQFIKQTMRCTDANTIFSVGSNDCTLPKTPAGCKQKFNCANSGDVAAWPGNANIFYICTETRGPNAILYPSLYRCPAGQTFNGEECTAPAPPKPICTSPGKFPNANNCRMYFLCTSNLTPYPQQCPNNQHFSATMRTCVLGAC